MKSVFKYWALVVAWMFLIFLVSTDLGAGNHTSRIIQPILRWLYPDMPYAEIARIHILIRKIGHLTEYAVLAVLVWRALVKPKHWTVQVWYWRFVGIALVVCSAYAASDEFHQSFVSSRGASVWDVMIDCGGAIAGLLLLWLLRARHGKKRALEEEGDVTVKTSA